MGDTLSRLQSSDPEIARPAEAVDTEIPCFTVDPDVRDPTLLYRDDIRLYQGEDTACNVLRRSFGASLSLEVDDNGILGCVLPTGEFQLVLPAIADCPLPVTVFTEMELSQRNNDVKWE